MTARLRGRRREAGRVLERLAEWAAAEPGVQAVVLVGSYARGAERMASDVDVVIVTSDVDGVAGREWFPALVRGARLLRQAR